MYFSSGGTEVAGGGFSDRQNTTGHSQGACLSALLGESDSYLEALGKGPQSTCASMLGLKNNCFLNE